MDPRVQYALEIMLGPGVEATALVCYERENRSRRPLRIVPSGFFDDSYGTPASLPTLPLRHIEGVPLLFGEPLVEPHGNGLVVKADIVASAYFLLTRYEEWVRREVRDEYGRFPGRESLPYRAGFIERPIVEEYSRLLRKWLGQAGVSLPQLQRRFSVLPTHDVDSLTPKRKVSQSLRSVARALLGRQRWSDARHMVAFCLGMAPNPFDNLGDVLRLDQSLTRKCSTAGCQPLYFFMVGGQTLLDRRYDVRADRARNAIRQVLMSGAGVGLHASYEAGRNPELVRAERQALEEVAEVPVNKNRHHYLTWCEPEDGHTIAAAGITWDATLGYADVAGFRLGVCHPVPLFDPVGRCLLGIEEHPLIVMDTTLSRSSYMNLDEEAAFAHVKRLADATFRHQGEFVMLWHNSALAVTNPTYHRRLYPRVVSYLGELLESDERGTGA